MIPKNQFINSEPVEDQPRDDGDHEDYDLENWNDTPPHENGEGWDGNGFGSGLDAVGPSMAPVTLPGLEPGPVDLSGREDLSGVTSHMQRETNTESTSEESQTYSYVSP